ncbi:jg10382 [Pararge aegeria aegeria]|uniref:Jg10382 protein n=1 Tax=Pararge aegeria aegeria TaxID=348720 RepID=A0A8S4SGU9_9NEOP|nr:jg10382 [Pararge aegeria aegeria]
MEWNLRVKNNLVNPPCAASLSARELGRLSAAGRQALGRRVTAPRTRGFEEVRRNCQRSCGNRAVARRRAHARAARQQPCRSAPRPTQYPLNRTSYPAVRTPLSPCNF